MARRPSRAPSFSYQGYYRYFVTSCTYRRSRIFENASDAEAVARQISPCFESEGFAVVAYCVMPDHVHLLLEGVTAGADMREAVRRWKLRTGYEWRRRAGTLLWQIGYYDRVLRENDDTRAVVAYLLNNPVRAGLVRHVSEYPWLGSSRYFIEELASHAGDWTPPWK